MESSINFETTTKGIIPVFSFKLELNQKYENVIISTYNLDQLSKEIKHLPMFQKFSISICSDNSYKNTYHIVLKLKNGTTSLTIAEHKYNQSYLQNLVENEITQILDCLTKQAHSNYSYTLVKKYSSYTKDHLLPLKNTYSDIAEIETEITSLNKLIYELEKQKHDLKKKLYNTSKDHLKNEVLSDLELLPDEKDLILKTIGK